MTNTYVASVQLVRVRMTDLDIHGYPVTQIWVAAVPRDQAVDAVQQRIPKQWIAELAGRHLSQAEEERLNLRPGDVQQYAAFPAPS